MRRRTRLARRMRPARRVDGRAFRYASTPARPRRPVARHGALCAVSDGDTASRAAVGRRPARAAAGARCGALPRATARRRKVRCAPPARRAARLGVSRPLGAARDSLGAARDLGAARNLGQILPNFGVIRQTRGHDYHLAYPVLWTYFPTPHARPTGPLQKPASHAYITIPYIADVPLGIT